MPKFMVDTLISIHAVIDPKKFESAPEVVADDDPFTGLLT